MSKAPAKNPLNQGIRELSMRDMLSPVFRHRRVVIFSFCAVFLVANLVAWRWAARYYVATMQVFVEQDRSDPAISAGQSAAAVNNKLVTVDQVNSEVELLQGRDMLRSAAETCNLVDNKWSLSDIFMPSDPQQQQAMKLEDAANGLAKNIKVEAAPTSAVINVKYGRVGARQTPACVLQALN